MKIEYLADHKEMIPVLARWSHEQWSALYPKRTLADVEQLMLRRSRRKRLPLCLLGLINDCVIGMVSLKIHDLESRQDLSPWLAGLYVKKEMRNRGAGTELVKAIEQKAQQLQIKTLYLYTPDAAGFYSKLGWTVLEKTVWNNHPVTLMLKDLRSGK